MKLKKSLFGYSKKSVDKYTKEIEENNELKLKMIQDEFDLKKAELLRQIEELKKKI